MKTILPMMVEVRSHLLLVWYVNLVTFRKQLNRSLSYSVPQRSYRVCQITFVIYTESLSSLKFGMHDLCS